LPPPQGQLSLSADVGLSSLGSWAPDLFFRFFLPKDTFVDFSLYEIVLLKLPLPPSFSVVEIEMKPNKGLTPQG